MTTPVSPRLSLARSLSEFYHSGQTYAPGLGYFEYHVCGVVQQLQLHGVNEDTLIVAYLHDVIEDTACNEEIIKQLFGDFVARAVVAITKFPEDTKQSYLARCRVNSVARLVKLHDATFNATNCLKNKNKQRYNGYLETISLLTA